MVAECEDNGCIVFCGEDVVRGAAGDTCFVARVKGAGDVLEHVVVRLFLDARYGCRMSCSLSMFPVLLCGVVCMVQLSRLCVVFLLNALRVFLVW